MNTVSQEKPLLIAIALSHYCEKVRWALDYLDIDYVEENHTPFFHRQYTSRYGGTSVPVLVAEDKALTDSHDILQYLDSISEDIKLYPQDPQLRDRVKNLEKLFDEKLGVATRLYGYYYALDKPFSIAIAWGIKAPFMERIKTVLSFPKIPQLLQQFYNVTPETKDAALKEVKEVFGMVDRELSSDQKYLVGDCLSTADITFAALASPILRPQNHPVYSSELSKISPERLSVIEELRSTPAGQLAMRMYREHRQ